MTKLPNSWCTVRLSDVVEKAEKIDPKRTPKRQFEYIDISSIDPTTFTIKGTTQHTGQTAPSRARQVVNSGDVLFSTVRPYLRKIASVPSSLDQQIASTGFTVIRPVTGVEWKYVLYYCMTDDFINAMTAVQRGTSYPAVRDSDVFDETIPLPPLAEQKRIVARIEELFSEIDNGVANLYRAKELLGTYRQSVLKAAFDGTLTEDWRSTLARGEHTGSLDKLSLSVDEIEAESRPDCGVLPSGWVWTTPSLLSSAENYALAIGPFGSNLKVSDYRDSGVPLVFVRNIRSNSFGGADDKFITEQKAIQLEPHRVRSGDILITKMGDPPGDACMYPLDRPDAIITADCIKMTLDQSLPSASYVVHLINSPWGQRQIARITRGVAQRKVSLGRFKNIPLPLAPRDEQSEIARRIDEVFDSCSRVESEIEYELSRTLELRQSVLMQAFTGNLVPQDPDDEPASVLLERITADQATQKSTTSRKKRKSA
mgnify:CR=1 FL=1